MTTTDSTDDVGAADVRVSRVRGPVTPTERGHIRNLAAAGGSARSIAREVGRSHDTVSRVAGDLLGARRGQTAKATEARRIDAAAERDALMGRLLRASNVAVGRWAGVTAGDHRGSADQARAIAQMVTAWARLDERQDRTRRGDHSDVDRWHAHIAGTPDPNLMPLDHDDLDAAPRGADH